MWYLIDFAVAAGPELVGLWDTLEACRIAAEAYAAWADGLGDPVCVFSSTPA